MPGGREADFPHGIRKSLLFHLLQIPWQHSSPVIAFERTHPLALEMGKPFITRGPSAGPSAHTIWQQLPHKGCHPIPFGSSCSWPLQAGPSKVHHSPSPTPYQSAWAALVAAFAQHLLYVQTESCVSRSVSLSHSKDSLLSPSSLCCCSLVI